MTISFNQDLGPRQSYYCHVFEAVLLEWEKTLLIFSVISFHYLSQRRSASALHPVFSSVERSIQSILPICQSPSFRSWFVPSSLTSLSAFTLPVANPLHLLMAVVSLYKEKCGAYWHFWSHVCVCVCVLEYYHLLVFSVKPYPIQCMFTKKWQAWEDF